MKRWLQDRWWEIVCFIVFALLVAFQAFLPPVTGLANNSDFSYVLGKWSVCPADREKQDNIYLVTDYFIDPVQCTYDIGLVSVEVPLFRAAMYVSEPFTGEKDLDLRALAAVHLSLLLIAFGILLSLTRQGVAAVRYGVPALFILIFSDVAYTCYLNSVYLDAPAYLLLLCATVVAIAACLNHLSIWIARAYLVFAAALIFAKAQHAVLGFAFAAVAVVLAFRPATRWVRVRWAGIAALLVAATLTMLSLTPPYYRVFAIYDQIFARLAIHDPEPWQVLRDLGLGEDEMKLVNTNAQTPGVPVYDEKWRKEFLERTSFAKLARYYLDNPDVVVRELNSDLNLAAPVLRPTDMANYREKDGYPPKTMATRFSLWSSLRSAVLHVFPYHVLLFYLLPWAAWIAGWKWPALRWRVMPVALTLSVAGMGEFAMTTLTDCLDNSRHLFVFHVITEMLILMIAAAVLDYFGRRPLAQA
jgi:hypothetical protein